MMNDDDEFRDEIIALAVADCVPKGSKFVVIYQLPWEEGGHLVASSDDAASELVEYRIEPPRKRIPDPIFDCAISPAAAAIITARLTKTGIWYR